MASKPFDPARDDEADRKDVVASIAGQITRLPTGDRALLRRLFLTQSSSSRSHQADGIVVGLLHRAGLTVPESSERYKPWRVLVHVAALLSGTSGDDPHAPKRRVGAALHEAGYSPNRFLRLTAARGPALDAQIIRAARVLAQARSGPVDLWSVLHLAGIDPDRAEEARLHIAKAFYSAAARSEGIAK